MVLCVAHRRTRRDQAISGAARCVTASTGRRAERSTQRRLPNMGKARLTRQVWSAHPSSVFRLPLALSCSRHERSSACSVAFCTSFRPLRLSRSRSAPRSPNADPCVSTRTRLSMEPLRSPLFHCVSLFGSLDSYPLCSAHSIEQPAQPHGPRNLVRLARQCLTARMCRSFRNHSCSSASHPDGCWL